MDSEKLQLCADAELPPEVFNLSPNLQDAFFRAANRLMQKEAETFLNIISSSRSDISSAGSPTRSPQRNIRSPFKSGRNSSNEAKRPVTADYERAAIDNYLRQVGREQTMPGTPSAKFRQQRPSTGMPSYARPVTAASCRPQTSDSRPGTSHRIRLNEKAPFEHELSIDELSLDSAPKPMLNLDDKADQIRKEQEELLHQMEYQGQYLSEERRRQAQLLREKKEEVREKKQKTANIAETLIDQGKQMDEKQTTDRQHQMRLLQERLEKKRFQRRKSLMTMSSDTFSDSVEEEISLS